MEKTCETCRYKDRDREMYPCCWCKARHTPYTWWIEPPHETVHKATEVLSDTIKDEPMTCDGACENCTCEKDKKENTDAKEAMLDHTYGIAPSEKVYVPGQVIPCCDPPMYIQAQSSIENVRSVTNTQVGGDHYKKYVIQPGVYAARNHLGFWEGCVVKYVTRYKDKGGLEDLEKAIHCLKLIGEIEYGAAL